MTNKEILGYILTHIHAHGTDDLMEFRQVVESIYEIFRKAELYDEMKEYEEYKQIIKEGSE